jgi:hypothetical protein
MFRNCAGGRAVRISPARVPITLHILAGKAMPEDMEVPSEHLHERIHEEAEKANERWILLVAMSAALLAVLAAVSSLVAGHRANEALLEQIQATDQWSYYQAKGVKAAVMESKMELLRALGKPSSAQDEDKLQEYQKQQKDIEEVARGKEASSSENLRVHDILARGVTVFQIAIAVAAISVITKKRWLWWGSLAMSLAGIGFLVQGLL